jgi:hypothetical protein
MKVYDCFIFFNELDLLEIRLNELKDVVDYFVLVEWSLTHSGKKKPFYFEENKFKYSEFLDKIIHVKVNDKPNIPARAGRNGTFHNRHDMEWYQRNCIDRGLVECKEDDIIIVSDVDEIPTRQSIIDCKKILEKQNTFVSFKQRFFYYKLNGMCTLDGKNSVDWWGPAACKKKLYTGGQDLRNTKGKNKSVIKEGGWHFSYLGDSETIIKKIESYSHAEWDNEYIKNPERIQDCINQGSDLFGRPGRPRQVYIKIDNTFPEYVLKNIEKFKHFIKQ